MKGPNWSFLSIRADFLPGPHIRTSTQGYNVQIHNKCSKIDPGSRLPAPPPHQPYQDVGPLIRLKIEVLLKLLGFFFFKHVFLPFLPHLGGVHMAEIGLSQVQSTMLGSILPTNPSVFHNLGSGQ